MRLSSTILRSTDDETYPYFVQLFLQSIYVDDVSFGANNDDDAYKLYLKSKTILRDG